MNVELKTICEQDLELLRNWRMKNNVTKYMLSDPIITQKSQIEWYKSISNDNSRIDYVIVVDNVKIGYYGITNIDNINSSCEIGFYIGDDNYRGKGIFKVVQRLAENIIYDDLYIKQIKIVVFKDNPICNYYYKIGFNEKENERFRIKKNDKYYEVISLYKIREY